MEIFNRIQKPTPKIFRKIRNVGLVLAAISSVIISAPIALPATLVTISGYLAVAGGIASAICQITTEKE